MRAGEARARLLELLREHSLALGEFTLASGRKSGYYLDTKRATLLAEGGYLAGRLLLDLLREERIEVDAIGGPTIGADPIVCAAAALSHMEGRPLRAFLVRKEAKAHGTGRRLEGNLAPGSRVAVVEDVVTTGGSTLDAVRAVEEEGHRVVAVVCLVDREEGGADRLSGYPFYALYRGTEILGGDRKPR